MSKKSAQAIKDKRRRKEKKEQQKSTVEAISTVKLVTLLALRNKGYGKKRLKAHSDAFDEILVDISNGHLSVMDIPEVLMEETGITMKDLGYRE